MSGKVLLSTVAISVLAFLSILMVTGSTGSAQELQATWTLHARSSPTSFVPGGNAGPGQVGYEIVSFGAVPPSTGLSTYVYGGPDLPAEHGGPMASLISCDASFSGAAMNVVVSGAYPYAGCVFFLGVTNSGTSPIQVDLGILADTSNVTCNGNGCEGSDVDIVAGGPDAATIAELCVSSGGTPEPVAGAGARYSIPAGATFVCPLFVTVLQPASEGTTYNVVVTPPPLEPPGGPVIQPVEPTESATATPTPVNRVEGDRTAGALTPIAPSTGSGMLVQRAQVERGGTNAALALALVVTLGAIFAAAATTVARRR